MPVAMGMVACRLLQVGLAFGRNFRISINDTGFFTIERVGLNGDAITQLLMKNDTTFAHVFHLETRGNLLEQFLLLL